MKRPGKICIAIEGAVDPSGLYWIPATATIESLLKAPPAKAKKNFSGSVLVWRHERIFVFVKPERGSTLIGPKILMGQEDKVIYEAPTFRIPGATFQLKPYDIVTFDRNIYI
ncbi:MAG: hypothetical protein QOD99_1135 [Chthoniobacter sp.]|jgi:hypothetical protein|nr:hypothetical protein [Chthoniobacter sp.]